MKEQEQLLRIARLIASEKLGQLTKSEELELRNWLSKDPKNAAIYMRLQDHEELMTQIEDINHFEVNKSFEKIALQLNLPSATIPSTSRFTLVYKYIAAAVLILAVGIAGYLVMNSLKKPADTSFAQLVPGTQKAMLITSDKQHIDLGEPLREKPFEDQSVSISDTQHTLIYTMQESPAVQSRTTEYNEVITPKGGEYSLILSDGTRVKLNADSRLKFPVRFTGETREVELSGEAYFDVAPSAKKPFTVHAEGLDIRVYGTIFNVSAYTTDAVSHTTLVEGKVSINLEGREIALDPGQQLRFASMTHDIELREVNTDLYTSWTQGLFVFENEKLSSILTKLSRWYDFEVHYESEELKQIAFTGDLKRYQEIQPILAMISMASDIEFSIKNKEVIVHYK